MKFIYHFSLILSLCFITSCEKSNFEIKEEPIEVTFGLNVPFITSYDELISKASAKNNYTYGIRIQQFNENTSSYEPYAMGAFNDISLAKITLYSKRKYNIEAAVINNLNHNLFSGPGGTKDAENNSFSMGSTLSLTNDWHNDIAWGDSYYGKITDYTPSENTVCSVDLASQTTGVKIIVEGVNEGSVRLTLSDYWYNSSISIALNENTEIASFLSIEDMFGKTYDTYETKVKLEYIDVDGTPITFEDKKCTFKIGSRKVFKIKITNSSNTTVESGFDLSYETPILPDENPLIIEGTI